MMTAYGGQKQVVGMYIVYYKGLAESGGKACVEVEQTLLCGDIAATAAVDATFADSHNTGVARADDECPECGKRDGAYGVPGVYAHAVCAAGEHRAAGADADDSVAAQSAGGVVRVYVGVIGEGLHGTGS